MVARAVLLLLATIAFGVAPFITEPFRGYAPDMFPVKIDRPSVQPAGFAFSIWGLIYLGLIAHALFGFVGRKTDPDWDTVRPYLALSVFVGALWLWIAPYFPITATFGIWLMLIAAIIAIMRINVARDPWLLGTPIAIYAGWLTAAANVSLGVIIAGYGWLTDTQSAAAMLALVLAITVMVQLRRPQLPAYGLTVIWALFGIAWVNWTANFTVSVLAIAGMVIMAITIMGARRKVTAA
jgi:hypothetical protein